MSQINFELERNSKNRSSSLRGFTVHTSIRVAQVSAYAANDKTGYRLFQNLVLIAQRAATAPAIPVQIRNLAFYTISHCHSLLAQTQYKLINVHNSVQFIGF